MNRGRSWLLRGGPFLGLSLVVLLFAVQAPGSFLRAYNLQLVAMHSSTVALGALGMTLVVVAGGIDLSIGAVVALCSVVAAKCAGTGTPPLAAAIAGVLLGTAFGCANGLLITRLSVVPFIVTLGTMGIARGAAKWLADDQKVDADPGFLAALVRNVPEPAWLGVGPAVWLVLAVGVLLAFVLRRTVFGVHVQALGANEQAAVLCGVDARRTKLLVYALCGGCAGLVGVLYFGLLRVGDPTVAMGLELQVIAAVVIGGGSLSGGQGSLLGAWLGAVMMEVLHNGCTLCGVRDSAQEVLIGAIIVAAVALDRWRSR